jgi:hypothetical protein
MIERCQPPHSFDATARAFKTPLPSVQAWEVCSHEGCETKIRHDQYKAGQRFCLEHRDLKKVRVIKKLKFDCKDYILQNPFYRHFYAPQAIIVSCAVCGEFVRIDCNAGVEFYSSLCADCKKELQRSMKNEYERYEYADKPLSEDLQCPEGEEG